MKTPSKFDSLIDGSFVSELRYEFWPALEEASSKLLIILHGRGDSLEGFHFLPSALGIDRFNVLFLQAPDPYGLGYSWYDLPPNQGPGIQRSRQMLTQLLNDILKATTISSRDIFLCGFSQGCLMCIDVGLRYPKPIGGIIGISGYVFFEEEYPAAFSPVAQEQRFWISHGFEDDVLPFENTLASVERLKKLGVCIDWNPLEKVHTVDENEEIALIKSFLLTQLDAN